MPQFPLPDLETSHRNGRWSYSNGKIRIISLRGHARLERDIDREDSDGFLFLPFLIDCLSKTLLNGGGAFDPIDFCHRVQQSPGHPCLPVPPSLLRRRLIAEELTYFFDDWCNRSASRMLHRPPPQRYMSATYLERTSPFICLWGVKISKVDKTPIANNFFVIKMLLSRE